MRIPQTIVRIRFDRSGRHIARWLAIMALLLAVTAAGQPAAANGQAAPYATPVGKTPPASCPVTIPNGDVPPFGNLGFFPGPVFHGEHGIWASFGADGTVAWSPDMGMNDGGYGVKFLWFHDERAPGHLQVTGTYLGGSAPPLVAEVPGGYGSVGYQASGLIFSRLGCWRITASAGGSSMTFTVWLYEGMPKQIRSTWTSSTPPPYCHVTLQPSPGANSAALKGAPADTIAVGNDQLVAFLSPNGSYELSYQPDASSYPWRGVALRWWQNQANDLQPLIGGELTAGYGGSGSISYDLGASVPQGAVTTRVAFSSPGCWRMELRAGQASTTFTVWLWARELPPAATPVATPAA